MDLPQTVVMHNLLTEQVDQDFLKEVKNSVRLKNIGASNGEQFRSKEGQARLVTSLLQDDRLVCKYTQRDENDMPWKAEACRQGNRYMLHGQQASYDLMVPQWIQDHVLEN
eukprot:3069287-Pleurochrysis_carterae.AAC.2